jgi:hypothetical protein
MIPGANLLKTALTVIARQTITYYAAIGRTLNTVGQDVTTYAPGVLVYGSFQPVPRQLYQSYGLDLQKDYFMFYSLTNVADVNRDRSGDQIAYNGQRFQCESNREWYTLDFWKGILCVHIGYDIGDAQLFGFGTIPSSTTYQNFTNGNFVNDE